MQEKVKRYGFVFLVAYLILVGSFYFLGGEQLHWKKVNYETQAPAQVIGEIVGDTKVEQIFSINVQKINEISVLVATFDRENTGSITFQVVEVNTKKVLFEKYIFFENLVDNAFVDLLCGEVIENISGKDLLLTATSPGSTAGNAVTIYRSQENILNGKLTINGEIIPGSICFNVAGEKELFLGKYYFLIAGVIGVSFICYLGLMLKKLKTGGKSYGLVLIIAFIKYRFLLSQLISRDFKTKYKRSVLGVLWSLLNPLLTMVVQYFVFSTIFKSNIENYPVYLLTGIVIFSFFTEATSMSLTSIVGNAQLITKVYVPKYIYPVSRVLSSAINMLFSMIPLVLVVILTKTRVTPMFLLLIFGIACTVIFCIGLGMVLSSVMVFFRDTQFLWGVVTMLWMYFTPIFYPEQIIPASFMGIYKMNPLYHFIRFNRIVIMQGVSPEPKAYGMCLVFAAVMLLIGCIIFKKTQDKFALYI